MGFYLVPFRQPNPPTRFLSITGHWNVSLLSDASLWNGMFGRVEGQYTTIAHIMLREFKNNKHPTTKKICVYGQGLITDCQVRKWFSIFHSGETSLRNEPRTGHLMSIKMLLENWWNVIRAKVLED